MCRLYGFRSQVLSRVHTSLVAAENALSRQSERHPDGWGVAYYVDRYPHLVRSEKKAQLDEIFRDVSAVVQTRTLLAHIRHATVGKVNVLNCHPFQHGPWTFAHNGEVSGFGKHDAIRAAVHDATDPRFRAHTLGTTDSEAAFYLFLTELSKRTDAMMAEDLDLEVALDALRATVSLLRDIAEPIAKEEARLNFLVSNGSLLIGYRHRRDLFFSTHKTACPERSSCAAYVPSRCEAPVAQGEVNHLLITSERIAQNPNVWNEVGEGEYVAVDAKMRFSRGPLHVG